jgi:hypothetical protein
VPSILTLVLRQAYAVPSFDVLKATFDAASKADIWLWCQVVGSVGTILQFAFSVVALFKEASWVGWMMAVRRDSGSETVSFAGDGVDD